MTVIAEYGYSHSASALHVLLNQTVYLAGCSSSHTQALSRTKNCVSPLQLHA